MSDGVYRKMSIIAASATAFIFYVTIVSYSYAAMYYLGYLAYFGISIGEINFFPSVIDLVMKASPVIAAIFFVMSMSIVVALIPNFLGRILVVTKKGKWRNRLDAVLKFFSASRGLIASLVLLLIIALPVAVVIDQAPKRGLEDAKEQTIFTEIMGDEDPTCPTYEHEAKREQACLVIYANGMNAVVKEYSLKDKKFINGYMTLEYVKMRYEQISIE